MDYCEGFTSLLFPFSFTTSTLLRSLRLKREQTPSPIHQRASSVVSKFHNQTSDYATIRVCMYTHPTQQSNSILPPASDVEETSPNIRSTPQLVSPFPPTPSYPTPLPHNLHNILIRHPHRPQPLIQPLLPNPTPLHPPIHHIPPLTTIDLPHVSPTPRTKKKRKKEHTSSNGPKHAIQAPPFPYRASTGLCAAISLHVAQWMLGGKREGEGRKRISRGKEASVERRRVRQRSAARMWRIWRGECVSALVGWCALPKRFIQPIFWRAWFGRWEVGCLWWNRFVVLVFEGLGSTSICASRLMPAGECAALMEWDAILRSMARVRGRYTLRWYGAQSSVAVLVGWRGYAHSSCYDDR
ncbi:hypothetical protein P153DRAFT_99101 [Dothidotthia symphoricarpi CBS 119687]|uniref:Uncharacterized protein n=1 Tax=Dothidotthia symphoricarpi CBS 119687 TaxID=1392245 RepID=A0A6A6ATD7_9PLEO|nr:uncharacterized protein P153DRAFT_99101 [Dothidotthia symphoricarpi CBS 119687]KAF2133811.1 hypothetical protein P153DRAFT_99101 [Dothidotthia symphoricarpi CBS 119687]